MEKKSERTLKFFLFFTSAEIILLTSIQLHSAVGFSSVSVSAERAV